MSKKEKPIRPSVIAADAFMAKLKSMEGISTKAMFGGFGFMYATKMFGFVDAKGNVFLKANDSNRGDFEKAGAEKHHRMPYYTIPEAVMTNARSLKSWVKKSIAATQG